MQMSIQAIIDGEIRAGVLFFDGGSIHAEFNGRTVFDGAELSEILPLEQFHVSTAMAAAAAGFGFAIFSEDQSPLAGEHPPGRIFGTPLGSPDTINA